MPVHLLTTAATSSSATSRRSMAFVAVGGGLDLFLQGGDLAVLQAGGPLVLALRVLACSSSMRRSSRRFCMARVCSICFFSFSHWARSRPSSSLSSASSLSSSGQPRPADRVLLLGQGVPLQLQLHLPALAHVDLHGAAVDLHAHAGGSLVHEVHGLVGQEAVGDVAAGELGRLHQGRVPDAHAVVQLVALLQAAQDADGVLDGGLLHEDRLEAPRQGRVLLDVLAGTR